MSATSAGGLAAYLRFVADHRRLLAFGILMTLFSSAGQTFLIALSGGAIRAEFGLSDGGFGAVYSAATLCSALSLPWVGRLIDRVELRTYALAVAFGLAAACATLAAAANVAMLLVAFYGLRLAGQGLMTHTAMTGLAREGGAGRGKALSIGALGFPTGEALFPPLVVLGIATLGWRGTWLATAAVILAVVPAAVLWLLRTAGRRLDEARGPARPLPTERPWSTGRILRDPRFLALVPVLVAPGFINTGVFFHQVALVAAKGWPLAWFAATFAAYAAATVATSLTAGPVVDRIGATRIMPVFLLPLTVALAALAFASSPAAALVYMLLAGVTAGVNNVVGTAVWVDLYGEASLGTTRSLAASVMVFSSAVSPALFGVLLDLGVRFPALLGACALGTLAASGTAAAFLLTRRPASGR